MSQHTTLKVDYGIGGTVYNFGIQPEPGGAAYRRDTLEVRRYWGSNRLTGLYAGPYVRLNQLNVSQFLYNPLGNTLTNSCDDRLMFNRQAYVWAPGILAGV